MTMTIKKSSVKEYLARPLDSFTWMKTLPREVLLKELNTFKVRPVFKTEPWDHQLVCHLLGMTFPNFLFLLDMGMGKTAIDLNLFVQMVREGKVKKGIVTVPRLINLGSWEEGVAKHSDLSVTLVEGSIADKYEQLLHPQTDLTVIDYAGFQSALSKANTSKKSKKATTFDEAKIRAVAKNYQFFTSDETHKAKNKDSTRYSILNKFTQRIQTRYGMTGTLFGRDPLDVFSQFYLIDRGETFGPHIGLFREAFFEAKFNGFGNDYVFKKSMSRTFFRFTHHRSIRYSEWENPNIPEKEMVPIKVKLAEEQREYYYQALQGLIQSKGKTRQLDASYLRMRQILAGFIQWKEDGEKLGVTFPDNPKLQALERILAGMHGTKMVVSHEFIPSGQLVADRLTSLGIKFEWLYGKSKNKKDAVKRFLADPDIEVFLMNSESGGTGTDGLQEQASILVFYECPESPITRQQVIKRIVRPGQKRKCKIYDLVAERTIDLKILRFNEEGKSLHDAIIDGEFSPDLLKNSD